MYNYTVEEGNFDELKPSRKNSFNDERHEDPLLELKVSLDEKLIKASIREEFRKTQQGTTIFRSILFAAFYPFYILLILKFFS